MESSRIGRKRAPPRWKERAAVRHFATLDPMPLRKSANPLRPLAVGRRKLWLVFAGPVGMLAALMWWGMGWTARQARSDAVAEAGRGVAANASLLASEMQKFRLLPSLLVEYPDVQLVALDPKPGNVDRLNRFLARLARRTGTSDIYVMNRSGLTLSASNWESPRTFVGQNYAFRPYFRDAMRTGSGSYFALGTISREPGLYLARRIEHQGRVVGVLVVKIEFFDLERVWTLLPGTTLALDSQGIALVSSRPDWRLRSLGHLTDRQRHQFETSARFPGLSIAPLPLHEQSPGHFILLDGSTNIRLAAARTSAPGEGLSLLYLLPLEPFVEAQQRRLAIGGLVLSLLSLLVAGLLWRSREKEEIRRTHMIELEQQVQVRTGELEAINQTLLAESFAREQAVTKFREAREALARANRLTILGVVAAEVAHEISQPVAAIRNYSENAAQFLERGEIERSRTNLENIIGLTGRIGAIASQLRSFTVRRAADMQRCSLAAILDGALLIIGESIRHSRIHLIDNRESMVGLFVHVVQVQMEQVMVNLLQNSLQALDGRANATIVITAEASTDTIEIAIADNGPGIPPSMLPSIFAPFITTKPKGMGLGLGISRDIIASFGGTISHHVTVGGGATFRIVMRKA